MATINPTDYNSATKPLRHGALVGHRVIIGTALADDDVIKVPFQGTVAVFACSNTAVAAGSQLQVDNGTAKQITIADAGNNSDTFSLLMIEL